MPVVLVMNGLGHPSLREIFPEAEFVVAPAAPEPLLPRETAERIDAVMVNLPGEMTRGLIAALPRLRVISAAGVGVHNIDVVGATEAGVPVVNQSGIGTEPVSEHAVGMMLSLCRQITPTDRLLRSSGWSAREHFRDSVSDSFGAVLSGKTVGIIGLGRIGRRIAEICMRGFGMRAIGFSPSAPAEAFAGGIARRESVAEICAEADYVVLAGAYRPDTHHLVKASDIGLMKPGSYFINIARGGMVDQAALYDALRNRRIAGAGIDVFDPEPAADDDPLLQLDNVVVTPHVAGFAEQTMKDFAQSAVDQIRDVLGGRRPRSLVNPEVWEERRSV